MEKEIIYYGAISLAVVGGFTAGYFAAKGRLKKRFDEETADIADQMRQHYMELTEKQRESVRTEVMHDINRTIIERQGYTPEPEVEAALTEVETEEEISDEVEIPVDRSLPYIIAVEEFIQDFVEEHEKLTVTYFEGDDTLTDDMEEVIPDPESLLGDDALTKFGYRSDDNDIVYVRNERISTDFEVIRDARSYTEVALGIKEPKTKPLRMREVD